MSFLTAQVMESSAARMPPLILAEYFLDRFANRPDPAANGLDVSVSCVHFKNLPGTGWDGKKRPQRDEAGRSGADWVTYPESVKNVLMVLCG